MIKNNSKHITKVVFLVLFFALAAAWSLNVFAADSSSSTASDQKKSEDSVDKTGWVPIEVNLPTAMFVGTPEELKVNKVEKPLGKPRPPFLAPKGTTNVALHKPVTGSDNDPIIGKLKYITDGIKEASDGCFVELLPGKQYITIDLGKEYQIWAIIVWHYHLQPRVYLDVIAQTADDADFLTNVKTIFNNDLDNHFGFGVGKDLRYIETNEGKLIDAKGVKGRYVRMYSNKNSTDDMNHYIEVSVYGTEIK